MEGFKKTGLYDGASSEWDESKHPRDKKGQFTTKAGDVNESGFINIQLFASNIEKMGERQLVKSIQSLEKRVEEHKNKISNPRLAFSDWDNFDESRQKRELRHWNMEINAFTKTIFKMKNELTKRSKK